MASTLPITSLTFLDCSVPIKCHDALSCIFSCFSRKPSRRFSPRFVIPASIVSFARSIVTYFVTPIMVISSRFRLLFLQACSIFCLIRLRFSATSIIPFVLPHSIIFRNQYSPAFCQFPLGHADARKINDRHGMCNNLLYLYYDAKYPVVKEFLRLIALDQAKNDYFPEQYRFFKKRLRNMSYNPLIHLI